MVYSFSSKGPQENKYAATVARVRGANKYPPFPDIRSDDVYMNVGIDKLDLFGWSAKVLNSIFPQDLIV